MTERTAAVLKANFMGTDPNDQFDDLVDSISTIADEETQLQNIWVSEGGDDDNGDGSRLRPYASPHAGLAAVTGDGQAVILMPGVYSYASSIPWPTDYTDVLLTGLSAHNESTQLVHTGTATEVIDIDPTTAAGSANFSAYLANLDIEAPDGVDGVTIDNGNMTNGKKLIVTFRGVSFGSADDTTEMSVRWQHNDQHSAPIEMHMHGCGLGGNDIEGGVYIDPKSTDDVCEVNGMNFKAGITFGTATIASKSEFRNCIMKDNGGSGGQDTQVLRVIGCVSKTGTTWAAAALADFADNAAEALLSFS
ncbi:MAG: hypothetical protein B5M51_00815 [Anaerolinea sp. 4484_236]|nr:MAG: hypothetical protein B5M51_00815 [Anaerolinea sp. 4484_236]